MEVGLCLSDIEEDGEPNSAFVGDSERFQDDGADKDDETLFGMHQHSLEVEAEDDADTLVDEMRSSEYVDDESDDDDEYEDDNEDEEYVDEGNSEEIIPDYPHVRQQRQSSRKNQVFYFKSTHQMTLTDDGIKQLQSTDAGRAALQDQQTEGANVQLRRRDVPLQYRSPDVIQPLLDNSETRFYPIIAKDDEVYLKIDATIMFPGRRDHQEPSSAEIRRSGLNTAIEGFFLQVHTASASFRRV
jgi:hypothetical protein